VNECSEAQAGDSDNKTQPVDSGREKSVDEIDQQQQQQDDNGDDGVKEGGNNTDEDGGNRDESSVMVSQASAHVTAAARDTAFDRDQMMTR